MRSLRALRAVGRVARPRRVPHGPAARLSSMLALSMAGLGFEERCAAALHDQLQRAEASLLTHPDHPNLAEDYATLCDAVTAMDAHHAANEHAEGLAVFLDLVPLLPDLLRGAGAAAKAQGHHPARAPAVVRVSQALQILSDEMAYVELIKPDDAEELIEALEPLLGLGCTVPGLMPLSWRLMRKATNQLKQPVEVVFYAAHQLPFYRTAFRLWSMMDWCPPHERVSTEEFLVMARKEILFRQLIELDDCAVEAAVSMSFQNLFTQGVLTTTPQEENLIRMLVGHVWQNVEQRTKNGAKGWTEAEASEIAECLFKTAMYFPLCQAFHGDTLEAMATEVPYPAKFTGPLATLFEVHLRETQAEAATREQYTGSPAAKWSEWLPRFAALHTGCQEMGTPWWRSAPTLPYGLGYKHTASLFRGPHAGGQDAAPETVLLLGVGSGHLVARTLFERQAFEATIVAVEGDPYNLSYGRRQLENLMGPSAKLEWALANPTDYLLKGPSQHFDAVECGNLMRHLPDPPSFLTLLRGRLRPGGIAVLELPGSGPESEIMAVHAYLSELSSGLPRPFLRLQQTMTRLPSVPEVRIARRSLIAMSAAQEARQNAIKRFAFGSYTGFVDTFVRVPSRRIILREWGQILEKARLRPIGVEVQANGPAWRQRLAELNLDKSIPMLEAWYLLEQSDPSLFLGWDACKVWCEAV